MRPKTQLNLLPLALHIVKKEIVLLHWRTLPCWFRFSLFLERGLKTPLKMTQNATTFRMKTSITGWNTSQIFVYQHFVNVIVHFAKHCEELYVRNLPKDNIQYIFHKWLPRSEALLGFTESSEKADLPVQPVPTRRQFIILVGLNTSLDKLKLNFDFFYLSGCLQIMQLLLAQWGIFHKNLILS